MKKIVFESLADFTVAHKKYESNNTLDSFFQGKLNKSNLDEALYLDLYNVLNNSGLLVEGVSTDKITQKVKSWINSGMTSVMKMAKAGSSKVLDAIKSMVNTIKKFEKKYPVLFKGLAVLIIIMILIIVSSGSAMAAGGGEQQMMAEMINIAAGLVSDLKEGGALEGVNVDSIGQGLEQVKKEILQTGDISGAVNNLEGMEASAKKVLTYVIKEAGNLTGSEDSTVSSLIKDGRSFLMNYAQGDLNIKYN